MKNIIKLEEAAMFGLCIYVFNSWNAEWWWYVLLVLGPDIGMLGYLAGNKAGAAFYNLLHHKGIAVAAASAAPGNWYCFIWPFFHGQDVWLWIKNDSGIQIHTFRNNWKEIRNERSKK